MKEINNVRQVRGEARRRWFADDYFDLIVWYENEDISGFQLCYDRHDNPRVYTWSKSKGHNHAAIDDGDAIDHGYKKSPILIADGEFQAGEILEKFLKSGKDLPTEVVSLVESTLRLKARGHANKAL